MVLLITSSVLIFHRILYDKRFSVFHYPVMDEDAPNYRSIVQNPMDMATVLQHVDCGHYLTCSAFLQDIDLIVANAKVFSPITLQRHALPLQCLIQISSLDFHC